MTRVRIIGAGGFGREVLGYLRDLAKAGVNVRAVGFLDDSAPSPCCELPVTPLDRYEPPPGERVVVAIGDPLVRSELAARVRARGCRFFTLIHPLAHVATTATIAEGTILSPFSFVGPSAHIGEHVILNVHSGADHESVIERFAYLAPHAFVGGAARVGEGAVLEMHAGVGSGSTVEAGALIPMGAHVTSRARTHGAT